MVSHTNFFYFVYRKTKIEGRGGGKTVEMEQQKKAPTSNNTAEESHLPSSRGFSVVQRENFADDSVMTVSNTNARIEISPTSRNRASWR